MFWSQPHFQPPTPLLSRKRRHAPYRRFRHPILRRLSTRGLPRPPLKPSAPSLSQRIQSQRPSIGRRWPSSHRQTMVWPGCLPLIKLTTRWAPRLRSNRSPPRQRPNRPVIPKNPNAWQKTTIPGPSSIGLSRRLAKTKSPSRACAVLSPISIPQDGVRCYSRSLESAAIFATLNLAKPMRALRVPAHQALRLQRPRPSHPSD